MAVGLAGSKAGSDAAARFKVVYANLPIDERRLTVVVMGEEPVSWEMAKREINADSGLGKKILEKLVSLEII